MAEITDAAIVRPSIRERMKSVARRASAAVVAPPSIAAVSMLTGTGLAITGVFVLAGTGWALIAGAVPMLLLAAVLIRGLIRVG